MLPPKYTFYHLTEKECTIDFHAIDFYGTLELNGNKFTEIKSRVYEIPKKNPFIYLKKGENSFDVKVRQIEKPVTIKLAVQCKLDQLKADLKTDRDLGTFFNKIRDTFLEKEISAPGEYHFKFNYRD